MLKILKTLNPKKATGCDQIPAKLLKHASLQIAPVISIIINKALDEGTFPNNLKKAEVIPVYKKSDKLNKSNYRTVSILPILAKVFEKVLAHQITPILTQSSLVTYQPSGRVMAVRTRCSPLLKIGVKIF